MGKMEAFSQRHGRSDPEIMSDGQANSFWDIWLQQQDQISSSEKDASGFTNPLCHKYLESPAFLGRMQEAFDEDLFLMDDVTFFSPPVITAEFSPADSEIEYAVEGDEEQEEVVDRSSAVNEVHPREEIDQFPKTESFRQITKYMWQKYGRITLHSLKPVRPGMIVYWLDAFPIGPGQPATGKVVEIGGARIQMKDRFGIVVGKSKERLLVVQMYTFRGRGLEAARAPHLWPEYVEIYSESSGFSQVSPHESLEVDFSCCSMDKNISVHLIPTAISLGSQIMIAGKINSDSQSYLMQLVRELSEQTCK
ncbi:hypothetical protein BCR34DRAFT_40630 [Clohesyomyces aquaticus]|uniref:Uncharacterized protein n=1 Tax=Clohesyomyces aquaticus TaxID=1231657 RepID=A0A1Y2A4S8_9PLEO|nr:hypothetical protein BCR34DRAFT_40630 [Clohesyomyces aquaticus]